MSTNNLHQTLITNLGHAVLSLHQVKALGVDLALIWKGMEAGLVRLERVTSHPNPMTDRIRVLF